MMANELHCKMYKQTYISKIFYLEEFCPLLEFLHMEETVIILGEVTKLQWGAFLLREFLMLVSLEENNSLVSTMLPSLVFLCPEKPPTPVYLSSAPKSHFWSTLLHRAYFFIALGGSFFTSRGAIHNWTKLSVVWRRTKVTGICSVAISVFLHYKWHSKQLVGGKALPRSPAPGLVAAMSRYISVKIVLLLIPGKVPAL